MIISPMLHNSKICRLQCNLSQGNELSQLTPHWSIIPFNNWGIWLFTQTCWCVFTRLCQCHLELEGPRKPSSFYLGHFSSSKFFNHITKDVSVLNFESNSSYRFSYFLTSTPLKHTSHHHGQLVASYWFFTWKNMVDLLQAVGFGNGKILTFTFSKLDIL
jgi:hypothetical protein